MSARWLTGSAWSTLSLKGYGACFYYREQVASGVPETIRSKIVDVCRDAFWYHDDVRAIFVSAGVPDALWERYAEPDASKAKIVRGVLNELRAMGVRSDDVQRQLVKELTLVARPHPKAPDLKKGQRALDELRAAAKALNLLSAPESTAAQQRQAAAAQRAAAQQQRRQRLGTLRDTFFELLKDRPRKTSELQARGYALEGVLADLFECYDIAYRRPYRLAHEQVDGSFHHRGFTYIVEAKWEKYAPDFGDLAKFKAVVDGKLDSTRGIFLSMAGFDENSLEHFLNVTGGVETILSWWMDKT
jgi:hypothetical protein